MPKRKKHARLPSGFGCVRYLGAGRSLPYAVHPPAKERDEHGYYKKPKPLCYVPDWYTGFAVLSAYHAGTYKPGIEYEIAKSAQGSPVDLDLFCRRVLRDFALVAHSDAPDLRPTLSDVYSLWYEQKYGQSAAKQLSRQSRDSTRAAYKKLSAYHDRALDSITLNELQDAVNALDGSLSSVSNVVTLLKALYRFAVPREMCRTDIAKYLVMPKTKEVEHGMAFTNDEIKLMWKNKEDDLMEMLLIMCLSGYRISAYNALEVNLDEMYFRGGVKTAAGKNRIVPIHSSIQPLVTARLKRQGCFFTESDTKFRARLAERFPGHTPHDCRHTFSALCESYGVADADRRRMMGHSFGADITNGVYGHRTLEELREQIEKIKIL